MDLSYLSVFGAGLLTFLSPCILPMVPIIAAQFLMNQEGGRFSQLRAMALFAAGFLLTFTLMGLSLPFLSEALGSAKTWLIALAALVTFLYGLKMTGLALAGYDSSKIFGWMGRTWGVPDFQKRIPKSLHGFLFGATFGLTWTPCVGPILAGVLTYVGAQERSVFESASLMFSFGLGVVLPFSVVALGGDVLKGKINLIKRHLGVIERVTGVLLMGVSIYLASQLSLPSFSSEPKTQGVSFVASNGERGDLVTTSPDSNLLLFFHTESCPVCRAMEKFLPEVERACTSAQFRMIKINIDNPENSSIATKFNVRAVPTITLLSKERVELKHSVGYQSESALVQSIQGSDAAITCAGIGTGEPRRLERQDTDFEDGVTCPGGGSGNGLTC